MEILKDKAYKDYDYVSRYASFPYYYNTEDNKYIYGITSHLKKDAPFVLHKTQMRDTYDSIALKYYGNPTYFWVICDFNDIQDPFSDIPVGIHLKVPTLSIISFEE